MNEHGAEYMQAVVVKESIDRPERTTAVSIEAVAGSGSYAEGLRVGYGRRIRRGGDDSEVEAGLTFGKSLEGAAAARRRGRLGGQIALIWVVFVCTDGGTRGAVILGRTHDLA
ncbi:hypothetical protein BDW22DRAFT_1363686, partial [Trametopsis cervina]